MRQLVRYDLTVCLHMNRIMQRYHPVRPFFALVSRLGDGVFWYGLMAILPLLYGSAGLVASIHMLVIAGLGVLVYAVIKKATGRPRPYSVEDAITLGAPPLDQYSFPSGHTLHAVSLTLVAVHYFPALFWPLACFATLVAASRVVLGLHYPTDVLCGATIGAGLAYGSLTLLAGG
nr:phosphatase PAP2 family protein [Natronocella acetinitrilica]